MKAEEITGCWFYDHHMTNLDLLGIIEEYIDVPPRSISGGERRRAIAELKRRLTLQIDISPVSKTWTSTAPFSEAHAN